MKDKKSLNPGAAAYPKRANGMEERPFLEVLGNAVAVEAHQHREQE
jgi:hypothetical protein